MMNAVLQQDLLDEKALFVFTYTKFWRRVGAFLIDRVALVIFLSAIYGKLQWNNSLLSLGLLFILFVYKPLLEYIYGATLGKLVLGIKVVNDQYQRAGFKEIFLRNIFLMTDFIIALIFRLYNSYYEPGLLYTQRELHQTISVLMIIINITLLVVYIIDAIFLATAKDGRSLHDRIGKTFVVNSRR
jgi:uncharacterized RDD family membrane protein YckC